MTIIKAFKAAPISKFQRYRVTILLWGIIATAGLGFLLYLIVDYRLHQKALMLSVEKQWTALICKSGCTVGGQDWQGTVGREGCCFREKPWQDFFHMPSEITVPYLTRRIDYTRPTEIHICPYQNASEGELAVYALEQITHANWTEMPNVTPVIRMAQNSNNIQLPLPKILKDPASRHELKMFFLKKAHNQR